MLLETVIFPKFELMNNEKISETLKICYFQTLFHNQRDRSHDTLARNGSAF